MSQARAARKKAELTAKLDGLRQEFGDWRAAGSAGHALEKHHSQIEAVTGSLDVRIETLDDEISAGPANWAATEVTLLRLHEVWDFFRQKFALRYEPGFLGYLRLADEFTWACYQPAQERGSGDHNVPYDQVREPPLTFLNQVASPFTLARGASYARELRSAVLADGALAGIVRRLPVPVIGIPWFQLRHLPDALVLGHEVGHHVETDFRLTARLEALVDAAVDQAGDRRRWRGWLGEVFADVYGTLAAGPAFGHALADFIPSGERALRGSESYPPAELRIQVVAGALECTGFGAQAAELVGRWTADFPAQEGPAPAAQATAVATAFCEGPYTQFGGVALTDVLHFGRHHARAEGTARALLMPQALAPGLDIRALLAGAGLAFCADPGRYLDGDLTGRVLEHARRIEITGLRATRPAPAAPERDRLAGAAIAELL